MRLLFSKFSPQIRLVNFVMIHVNIVHGDGFYVSNKMDVPIL